MKRKLMIALTVLVMILGASMALYPFISNLLYQRQQDELAEFYNGLAYAMPEQTRSAEWESCAAYNAVLLDGGVRLTDPFDTDRLNQNAHPYLDLLNLNGDGGMGTLEIPSIQCNLTVYHGTDETILQKGVGHLQGSSLPVGGTGTHCVLSAHTGLPGKELFTNLDQLEAGDVFYLHVLGETLAYQVDQVHVVLPEETRDLMIDSEQDYVTLVTCTPYGVNSHRLLVRGVRIPYEEAQAAEAAAPKHSSTWVAQYLMSVTVGIGLAAALPACLLLALLLRGRRREGKR